MANALVSSQVDYCNSLLRSLSKFKLHKLQCIQKQCSQNGIFFIIYLLFYVAFNSQGHIAMGSLQVEETSAYCTVNHRASASNYQLSNTKHPARDWNQRPQRLEARTLIATPPSPPVRMVSNTSRYTSITPVLKKLHWLPVEQSMVFKTALFTNFFTQVFLVILLHIFLPTAVFIAPDPAKVVAISLSF